MPKKKAINLDQFFTPPSHEDDLTFLIGAAPEEMAQRASERGLPLRDLATAAIAPDPHQLRRLPHPTELRHLATIGDRAAVTLIASLQKLGQSMRDHGQIQPVIVYRDVDPQQPSVTHRLLNGQRRWSAAVLIGLPTLWAVEVDKPSEMDRLVRQYEENERRENFSDIERAWALITLKETLQQQAGGEVPWSVVEDLTQVSTSRRHDLLRLLRFEPAGQALILRYSWPEWTLRPLHMALHAGEIDQAGATMVLRRLTDMEEATVTTVAAMVKDVRRELSSEHTRMSHSPTESQNTIVVTRQMARIRRSAEQLRAQIGTMEPATRQQWQAEADQLRRTLERLLKEL
jgi:ParB/RepB/Spo0J family partition protein